MCDRIYAALVQHFGKDAIFKDIDNIPQGVNFADYIRGVMTQSAVAVVVIGRTWLVMTNAAGTRWLEDPGDFVHLEIEEALARHLPVIPLRVDGAAMPRADQLPLSLHRLLLQNGWEVHDDPYFETDIRYVKAGLERWVPSLQARLAKYARQQEAARQAAVAAEAVRLAASGVTAPVPGFTPTIYPRKRLPTPKPRVPQRRVLAYCACFGVVVAAGATAIGVINRATLPQHGAGAAQQAQALGYIVLALMALGGVIPALLFTYRYHAFWAGVEAALTTGALSWSGHSVGALIYQPPSLTNGSISTAQTWGESIGIVIFVAVLGVVWGMICGLVGAGVGALMLRLRPQRVDKPSTADAVPANAQTTTNTSAP